MEKASLNDAVIEMKKELVKMNAQVATGTALKNPGQLKSIKKSLARILTISNDNKKNIKEVKKSEETKKA